MTRKLLLAFLLASASPALGDFPTQVPAGFQDELVAEGLFLPTSLAFLPDGRAIVVERQGGVQLVADGGSQVAPLLAIPDVLVFQETGLLGVAVDPSWPSRPFVYVFYNRSPQSMMRLERYTASGDLVDPSSADLALGSPYLVLTVPDNTPSHNGGTLRFGPDGKLYVSIGEDDDLCAAQDSTRLTGGILRLDVDALPDSGSGPPDLSLLDPGDNPFPDDPNSALVYCMGLRNPFRFGVDPLTGRLYIGDVGNMDYEEVNEASGGENFGWPWREGPNPMYVFNCGGQNVFELENPIAIYAQDVVTDPYAVMGGPRYRPTGGEYDFPPPYHGVVFYTDFYRYFIRVLVDVGDRWVPMPQVAGQPDATTWGVPTAAPTDLIEGPDGALYYLQMFPGALRRILWNGSTTAAPEPALPAPAAFPNPFRLGSGGLEILVRTGPVSARILDARGRVVRSFEAAGAPSLRWDGRDGSGRAVSPGVYFLSVRGPEGEQAGRVTVLP